MPLKNKFAESKTYYCPHCKKILMKGDVKRLKMNCPHCHELVNAGEDKLLNPENEFKQ